MLLCFKCKRVGCDLPIPVNKECQHFVRADWAKYLEHKKIFKDLFYNFKMWSNMKQSKKPLFRCRRKLLVGLIILASLIIGCEETELPFDKIGVMTKELSVGETGVVDEVAVTLERYVIVDNYTISSPYSEFIEEVAGGHKRIRRWTEIKEPPEGAKFVMIYVTVKNVGSVKKEFPSAKDFSLYYKGTGIDRNIIDYWVLKTPQIPQEETYVEGYPRYSPEKYPNTSVEGWISFIVPAGIELKETTLKVWNLVWRLK